MILDLKSVFREKGSSIPLDYALDFSEETLRGEKPLKTPVTVNGTIGNRAGVVSMQAKVTAEYSAPCDRCAADCTRTYVIEIDRILVDELSNQADDDKLLLEDMKLDLYQSCFEEIVLNLPIKHLCNDSCKGICPSCGKNLNDGLCACSEE